jgi:hypothetical protein
MNDETPDLVEERAMPETTEVDVEVEAEVPADTDSDLSLLDKLAWQSEEEQQAAHERLAKSYVLAESALAYPHKKRKREPETESERLSRMVGTILGGITE